MERPLPHTVELRTLLLDRPCDSDLVDRAIDRFEEFCERWRDGFYGVISRDQIDEGFAKAAIEEALDESDIEVTFLSRSDLRDGPPVAQVEVFHLASRYSLKKMLLSKYDRDSVVERVSQPGHGGEDLERILESTLGTRRLQRALDNSFGASFGRLVKHDILAVWLHYFSYLLALRSDEATRFEKLIELMTKTPPVGKRIHPTGDQPWALWVH